MAEHGALQAVIATSPNNVHLSGCPKGGRHGFLWFFIATRADYLRSARVNSGVSFFAQ